MIFNDLRNGGVMNEFMDAFSCVIGTALLHVIIILLLYVILILSIEAAKIIHFSIRREKSWKKICIFAA